MKNRKSGHGQMSDSFITALFIILSGGFQDAYTYVCRGGVFANAQTGNIVLLSTSLFQENWSVALKYLIPIIAFTVGIAIAEVVHIHLKECRRIHWRQIILLGEIILLLAVGFFPSEWNAPADALVSFVCAMQVQTFHKVRGHAYASTMCIGNLRNGTEALCGYIRTHDREKKVKCLTYFGVIFVFAIGAGLGSILSLTIGNHAIWLCCGLLTISFGMMFIKTQEHPQPSVGGCS